MNTVARSTQGLGFGSALEVVPLAKRRSGVAAALAVVLVLPLGLNGGGYDGRSFTPLTLAFGAAAALAFLAWTVRLPRALVATVLALTALAGWVALSSVWARDGSFVELETRRCIVYAVALLAVGAIVDRGSRRAFLTSTAFAIVGLAVVAVVTRAYSGIPVDPFYGALLAEPVGYPNAMGVLAAVGAVLAIGLGATGQDPTARALRAAAPFLVVVLGATGSRGGALALGMGLAVLIGLSDRSARWSCGGCAASSLVVGGGAWGLAATAGGGGAAFVTVAVVLRGDWRRCPPLGRRAIYAVACGLVIAAGAAVAIKPPATTSSYRTDYWAAALTELSETTVSRKRSGKLPSHVARASHAGRARPRRPQPLRRDAQRARPGWAGTRARSRRRAPRSCPRRAPA